MRLRSAEKTTALSPTSMRLLLLSLLIIAGAGLSQAALAASGTSVDCKRLESSLRSLEVPAEELASNDRELETSANSTTPVLLLTPRASSISREVFNALPIVVLDSDDLETDSPDNITRDRDAAKPAAEVPPIAKSPLLLKSPEETATDSLALPRFQRQMYRTDI